MIENFKDADKEIKLNKEGLEKVTGGKLTKEKIALELADLAMYPDASEPYHKGLPSGKEPNKQPMLPPESLVEK